MTDKYEGYLKVDIELSPADIIALEKGTFVGDPVRTAIVKAAEDREIQWDTLTVWTNKEPLNHNGITLRAFVRATTPEENNE